MSAEKLTRNFKLAYGTGQFASGLMGYAMAIFLLFYYNASRKNKPRFPHHRYYVF